MSWDILPKANLQYFLQKLKGKLDAIRQGHIIKNSSGTSMTSRDDLQFVGTYVSDDSTNGKTKVNIVREFQSKAEIEALTGEAKKGFEVIEDNEEYIPYTGSDILFDNTDTSFEGDNVQEVLEEVDTDLGTKANKTDLSNFIYIYRTRGGIKTVTQLNAHTGMTYSNLTGETLSAPEIQGYTFVSHLYIEVGGFSGLFAFFDDVNKTATRTGVNPFVYNASNSNISTNTNLAYGMISLYQKNV